MTELLLRDAEVRVDGDGMPVALRAASGWRRVQEVVSTWRVETDWWRTPVRRDYVRCLLDDGDCVEVFRELDDGTWHWSRRSD